MNKIALYQVDAFANRPFAGNPAAVCILEEALPAGLMQSIAAENNLSETAFVRKKEEGFELKWFTPTTEIELCGHATLASAHVLWEEGLLASDEVAAFDTLSGRLTAAKKDNWIELNFPAAVAAPATLPEPVLRAIGVSPVQVAFAKDRYIVEVATPADVKTVTPDFGVLKHYDGVIVTSLGNQDMPYDFVSRYFVPSHGVDEDPVTGSSHCALVPYYAGKLQKHSFHAFQCSARGGELKLNLNGDRVLMAGEAITVIKGALTV
jgi:PhzF family phenazine biosynthesis protein